MTLEIVDQEIGEKALRVGGAQASPQFAAGRSPLPSARDNPHLSVIGPEQFVAHVMQMAIQDEELGAWTSLMRDRQLRSLLRDSNALLGSVVYGEATRVKNMPWLISSDDGSPGPVRRWRDIFKNANFGQGFDDFLGKIATDYLSQDNGFFVELFDRETSGRLRTALPLDKNEIVGFASLDAGQCFRTFDPEYPVVYVNPYTMEYFPYHHTRIIYKANFPQNIEMARGYGFCAVSRAFAYARLVRETGLYVYEKVTGQEPEVVFVSGISGANLDKALSEARSQAANFGQSRFKNSVFVAPLNIGPGATEVRANRVGIKGTPDGWDHEKEMMIAINIIALAFGLDAREIWQAIQTGATKGDAEVQHKKASAKGRSDLLLLLQMLINHRILPDGVTFRFDQKDDTEDWLAERVRMSRARRLDTYVRNGAISATEMRAMLAAHDDIDRALVPNISDNIESSLPNESVLDLNDMMKVSPAPADVQPPDEEPDEENPDDEEVKAPKQLGKKELSTTERFFTEALRDLVRAAPSLSLMRLMSEMDAMIVQYGSLAFVDGLRDGGATASLSNIPANARSALQSLIAEHRTFIVGFVTAAHDGKRMAGRIQQWVNHTIESFYFTGLMLADQDKFYTWVLGPTEHCGSCLALEGQTHSARVWLESGILPRISELLCTGINCGCSLEESSERLEVGTLETVPLRGVPQPVSAGGFSFASLFDNISRVVFGRRALEVSHGSAI